MSLRKLWEKEVVVRLTEHGFVETVRYFGVPVKSVVYHAPEAAFRARTRDEDARSLARVRLINRPRGAL